MLACIDQPLEREIPFTGTKLVRSCQFVQSVFGFTLIVAACYEEDKPTQSIKGEQVRGKKMLTLRESGIDAQDRKNRKVRYKDLEPFTTKKAVVSLL